MKTTKTNAERQAAWRQRKNSNGEGLLLVQAWLEPDVVALLDNIAEQHKTSRVATLRLLIIEEASNIHMRPLRENT